MLEDILITGNEYFTNQELLTQIRLKPGDPYLMERLREGLIAINSLYREHAYLEANTDIKEIFSEEGNGVTLVVEMQEGRKIRIGKIHIKGNLITRDDVIRRDLEIFPGQEVNVRKLERSLARLRRSQYFRVHSIDARFVPTGDPDVRDV